METRILNQDTQVISGSTTDTGKNFTGGLLQKGEAISGWSVIEKINTQSGEADIFLAQKNGKKSVIKYYRDKRKPKTDVLEKIKGINHSAIVKIFEFGYYNERFYEIMEYAEGNALNTKNEHDKFKYLPLSEEKALEICKEVIDAFKTFHEKGIIHRDIKPANLYYRYADGRNVVIGDFGISSVMDEMEKLHRTQSTSRTTGYAAPEVLSGIINLKMDYYALGVTLWELMAAKDPFMLDNGKPRNEAHLLRDTIEGRIADDILRKKPDLSKKMQRLIRGLLVVDYEHRWGYDEVTRHLAGEEVPVFQKAKKAFFYIIGDKEYKSLEELGTALMESIETFFGNEEEIKKEVFRGRIASYLEEDYKEIADKISMITDEYPDVDRHNAILKIAYLLNPGIRLSTGNGYFASNREELIALLKNAPETMLPLLKDKKSKLYIWLEIQGFEDDLLAIQTLTGNANIPDIDLIDKVAVILKHYTIKPFKLGRYTDFELSELEQIKDVPKDLQNHILRLVKSKSHEGLFVPWLELLSPDNISINNIKTGNWAEFLMSSIMFPPKTN
ncbi:hypothetical protein FACS1894109_07560 [Spirochaetia bacterium]|nr:hypothetical protein FACS1894109_07560 [Spirochaetia bacterium]